LGAASSNPAEPRPQDGKEAESRLVEAAIRLVAERAMTGFTLAEVGEAAGYSRGLPAHYFGRKEDLLALAAQYTVKAYATGLAQRPPSEAGLPRIGEMIRQYARGTVSRSNSGARHADRRGHGEAGAAPDNGQAPTPAACARSRTRSAPASPAATSGRTSRLTDQARLIYAFLRGQIAFAALDPQFDTKAVAEEFIATIEARIGRAE